MKRGLAFIGVVFILFAACQSEDKTENNNESKKDSNENVQPENLDEVPVDFVAEMSPAPNAARIDPTKDTIIFGDQGTAIFFPKNSLQLEDGSEPSGPVDVVLKEYYKTSDIIVQNLTTTAGGRLLETGGMINISAASEGKNVVLKNGKEVIVHFPKNGTNKNMEMFSGQPNADNNIEWKLEETEKPGYGFEFAMWYHMAEGSKEPRIYLQDGTDDHKWLDDNLKFNDDELEAMLNKNVQVFYTVMSDGKIGQIHMDGGVKGSVKKKVEKIISKFPQCKPYVHNGSAIDVPVKVDINVKMKSAGPTADRAYRKALEKKYGQFGDKNITNANKAELEYYIFNSGNLGWINCDIFMDDPAPKMDMLVDAGNTDNTTVKVVFKDIKSIVAGSLNEGKFHFPDVPTGKNISIVALRYEGNTPLLAVKEMTTGEPNINNLDFKEQTLASLQQELAKFN